MRAGQVELWRPQGGGNFCVCNTLAAGSGGPIGGEHARMGPPGPCGQMAAAMSRVGKPLARCPPLGREPPTRGLAVRTCFRQA